MPDAAPVAAQPACHQWKLPTSVDPKLPSLGKLIAWQRTRCALCGVATATCVVDHDHTTGLVRGLLCSNCNTLEGVKGPADEPFAAYRRRPPTTIFGVRLPYCAPEDYRCDRYIGYLGVPSAWSPGVSTLVLLDDPSDPIAVAGAMEEYERHSPGMGSMAESALVAFECVSPLRPDGSCGDQDRHLAGEPVPGTAVFAPTRAARAQSLTGTLAAGLTLDFHNAPRRLPRRGSAPLWKRVDR
ncbi:endonuclease domain-containing protein [Streptomyces sioyaensis]|uniref:endonuclease domain-containing protein n=1 Tax=Streptomyces sioyaensis TaxID=67364 RepID=UPI003716209A